MFTVKHTSQFDEWLSNHKDPKVKGRLVARLRKVQLGNLGDVKPVGEGVFEMREHFGPGWRIYYTQRGKEIIILLGAARNQPRTLILPKRSNWLAL
ncbi:type II toxin-antitoxin system RelE/ParE family toxin [Desulfonatronovibrio magnus]|uniref:type II toxin-antitoxin system RelE/ParE family toxin n=1 Tax=Desulfonatronovibrio magnus TaxID=698827 RepID=UPI000A475406|nr:type II toxin-antitoxin system RelE/ParE family toxin [Desulfonatronovibrio magnus]